MYSVIIPVYNSDKYIERAVNSILKQRKDVEIVIVDNGSTDNSILICQELSRNNPSIALYSEHKKGVSSARNKGIRMATSEWIVFLDSDDYLCDSFFDTLDKLIAKYDTSVVVYGYESSNYVRANGSSCLIHSDFNVSEELIFYSSNYGWAVWTTAVKRNILVTNEVFFDEQYSTAEEITWTIKLFSVVDKVLYSNSNLYHYCDEHENSISKNFRNNLTNIERVYKEVSDPLYRYDIDANFKQYLFDSYFSEIIVKLKSPSKWEKEELEYVDNKMDFLKKGYKGYSFKRKILYFIIRNIGIRRTVNIMNMKKKTIYLNFYSEHNFGDDLLLVAFLEKYKDYKVFSVVDYSYKEIKKKYKNFITINRRGVLFRGINKIRRIFSRPSVEFNIEEKCDVSVYVGGSIFIEEEDNTINFDWWNHFIRQNKIFLLDTNFGPYKTDKFVDFFTEIFNCCEDVCFRDQGSYMLFQNRCNTIRRTNDIVFSLQDKMEMYRCKNDKTEIETIIINVMNMSEKEYASEKSTSNYYEKIIEFIKTALDDNKKVVLMDLCSFEGDLETCNDIMKIVKDDNLSIVSYDGDNLDDILRLISSAGFIIASRFHLIIVSLLMNKKVYGIVYSQKTTNLLEDNKIDIPRVNLKDIDKLSYDMVVESINNYTYKYDGSIYDDAYKNYRSLDSYLYI